MSYVCPDCGATYPDEIKLPIMCLHKKPGKVYKIPQQRTSERINHWTPLHLYPIQNELTWSPEAATQFIKEWESQIAYNTPANCGCGESYQKFDARWDVSSPEAMFKTSVDIHNRVNKKLRDQGVDRKEFTLAQAYGRWRRKGVYESVTEYNLKADVIIPFHNGDVKYLQECLNAVLMSYHVQTFIHLIGDNNCEPLFEVTAPNVAVYKAHEHLGPYRITNALVSQGYCKTDFLALQDADDISLPDRLWKQLTTMKRFGYQMTSASMKQFVEDVQDGRLVKRFDEENIIDSGRCFYHVPFGRNVNSLRTMSKQLFIELNGFPDQMCSVDFHLDNVCHFLDVPTFWSTEVLGLRRLHSLSLTNGDDYRQGTKLRDDANKYVSDALYQLRATPTLACAQSFGALDKSPTIERIA